MKKRRWFLLGRCNPDVVKLSCARIDSDALPFFCEVFVALLSGRSCKCASAAPKFAVGKWWTGTLVP